MEITQKDEATGRLVDGLQRAGQLLALLAERMGKPARPHDPLRLAELVAEADTLFARLPASDAVKAEFSALMRSLAALAALAGPRDRLAALAPEEIAAGADEAAVAAAALPQFRSIADHLLGGP